MLSGDPLSLKASRRAAKQAARLAENATRIAARTSMLHQAQVTALESFSGIMASGSLFPPRLPVAIKLRVPLWDTALLEADARALLALFPPALQYGDLHAGTWRTLSLRSVGGALNDDSPASLDCYAVTPAWAASSYIVPTVLWALHHVLGASVSIIAKEEFCSGTSRASGAFQRVRLSAIPPGCK